ncbi:MaoC/PaaZ C-terminal domain-containing protein [Asanoa sp. WMMD1127]|uniref:MaoC/PaaZ C-terminal domain-containing protein n=1 Tax=Asanoa sp. WMMD1127 TaxID=3016107 RepID=UPI002417A3ED|nr:MaoC/PaaZ C-terminal domain-containing protein [Asanoa sp. WMMD1127]MDG4821951.1 MaoC/PaaZ C-terminal domain-containing protein [Asanoa sp. WMMD1127]
MSIVELDGPPELGPLYRRAAIRALPRIGLVPGSDRRPPIEVLPDVELVLRGVEVSRSWLADYDRVCGFRLTDRLPVTFPHVLATPLAMRLMTGPDFPYPVVGLVHVGNRITATRPIDAAERLDLSVRAVDLRPHERGRQFDIVAVATVDGVEVWRDVSTYLRRGRGDGSGGSGPRDVPPPASATWRVPARVGVDYARVSGDRNPIHTSRLGARLFGFPRPIAHGMWSKARCLAALDGRLPDAYTVEVAFKRPILLPGTVAFSATPGETFALHDPKTGAPHLIGTMS